MFTKLMQPKNLQQLRNIARFGLFKRLHVAQFAVNTFFVE